MSFFLKIISAFNEQKVSYVVVGGIAVVLHGHNRLTTDIDFVVELERENIEKAVGALSSLNYKPKVPVDPKDFADEKIRNHWIVEKGMQVFGFSQPDNPLISVDIFVEYPIPFAELIGCSVLKPLGPESIRICSIEHLISMKQRAGRSKDLEDIKVLNIIKENEH